MKYIIVIISAAFLTSHFHAQTSLDFHDLKEVNNEDEFLRVFLESGFESVSHTDYKVTVAFDYDSDDETAATWAYWYTGIGRMNIEFAHPSSWDSEESCNYDSLVEQIKGCNFSKTHRSSFRTKDEVTFLLYSCPTSKYKGKIGFSLFSEGGWKWGVIKTFPFE